MDTRRRPTPVTHLAHHPLGWATVLATVWGLAGALATCWSLGEWGGYAAAAIATTLLVGTLFWLLRRHAASAFVVTAAVDLAIAVAINAARVHSSNGSIQVLSTSTGLLPVLAAYHLGRRARGRTAVVLALLVALAQCLNWAWLWLWPLRAGVTTDDGRALHLLPMALAAFTGLLAQLMVPVLLGMAVRHELRDVERTRAEVAATLAARDADLAEALRSDRQRMARELHDLAAHHSTAAVINAKAARKVGVGDPAMLPELIDGVVSETQAAQASLRQMVDVLHDPSDVAPMRPQPSLADIPVLVQGARAINDDIVLEMDQAELAAVEVDEGIALAAYRIVQESLTNAHRHAPGAPLTVAVWLDGDELGLQVVNGRSEQLVGEASQGSGRGLTGMRQRAGLLGGWVEAGPHGRGWRVLAGLPLQPPPDAWTDEGEREQP